jgi:predicted dithiol-disulfide oxidoreductase (DUF899 family)
MQKHKIVSHDDWLQARRELLAKEKELTRHRDALTAELRDLPWEPVTKDYVFDGPDGKVSLAELFDGKSQLIVYHFMLAPDWDAGCKACSFWADNFNGIDIHLKHRDVSFLAISRAPIAKIEAYKQRMGWNFKWVSSFGSHFNFDFDVSYTPEDLVGGIACHNYTKRPSSPEHAGLSVFFKDADGAIYHTYSCYSRGLELLNGAYNVLDLAPKGRDEADLPNNIAWLERHDEYRD